MKKLLLAALIALPLIATGCGGRALGDEGAAERPNIIIIITDDQRYDTVGEFMPHTQARIFEQGVDFTNAYVTTPLCCPSRSSILTGMYAHSHGVQRNNDPLRQTTFVERLHEAGYFTGQVGKYLNSWDGSPRPEFDFWVAHAGGGSGYFNPRLNVNGSWSAHRGYITHILRDYALRFLDQAVQQEGPFLLVFAPNAPHASADPAPGDEDLYSDLTAYRPPNYNEADLSDKPGWLQGRRPLTPQQQAELDNFRRKQLQTLGSLDQAIGEMLDLLERHGKLENTAIFYISDNGYLWGEHRLQGKNVVYEPSIRVPFALRYPSLVPGGTVEKRLVANIDIAPTIYQLAGLPIPAEVDGRSLASLLTGAGEWRQELLIEGWPGRFPFAALHTDRYVYVETRGDRAELYDLEEDPYQLKNLAQAPNYAPLVAEMRERLDSLRGSAAEVQTGAARPTPPAASGRPPWRGR